MTSNNTLFESLQLFASTAKILNRTLNKGELVDTILQESVKILASPVAALCMKSVKGKLDELYISYGRKKRHLQTELTLECSPAQEEGGQSIEKLDDNDSRSQIVRRETGLDVSSRLSLPLFRRDSVFGVLDLYDPPQSATEDPHMSEVLKALADLFVIAWDNAELYEQAQQKSLQNSLLLDSAQMLSSSLELDEVLENLMTALKKVVDYDAIGIFLVKVGTDIVEPRVWRGFDRSDSKTKLGMKVGEGLVGWAIENGKAIYVPDTQKDERYVEARPETRSELVVPIKADDRIIGAFNVESDRPDAYSDEDLEFLNVFASQAAVSIERARLYREILANKSLEEQLNIARMIQRTFLPQENPRIKNFDIAGTNIPSQKVGGDYYDFIKIVDHQLGVAIADVSGKGIPASLIMAAYRASLIAEIRNNYAIRTILQKANRLLNESMYHGTFVTAVYGVLDSKNRIFTFSNAGHNPPLLIRKDGSYEELKEGGLALGIVENASYEERPVYVGPGDMVALYTDGVTEAVSPEGELFGETRILELLRENRDKTSEELVQLVTRTIAEFSAADFDPDDLTLVIIKSLP